VIIPSLGRLQYLNELIESIVAQTIRPLEILVLLDDNEHCRKISNSILTDESLQIMFCANLNLAEKRNFGASVAESENLIFSDDDDIWEPTRGELVCEALTQASVCCHNYGKFGDIVANDCSRFGNQDRKLNSKAMLDGANRFGGGSAIAAKRYIILALPFSREFRYCEDFEWWSRILFAEIEVRYLGSSLVKYRTHTTNMTNAVGAISRFGLKLSVRLIKCALLMVASSIMIALRSIFRPSLFLLKKFKNKPSWSGALIKRSRE